MSSLPSTNQLAWFLFTLVRGDSEYKSIDSDWAVSCINLIYTALTDVR